MTTAFWIDYDHDRYNADTGVSHYAAYLRDRQDLPADAWYGRDVPGFAAAAWRIATTPHHVARLHPRP